VRTKLYIVMIMLGTVVCLRCISTDKTGPSAEPAAAITNPVKNPLIWADVPDVDVVRVGNYFFMSSTSMHMMPGVPIMRSSDLVNWEIVSYVYDTLENNDAHNLMNGRNIYGKGSWASSLRYHNNTFYVCFASNDTGRTYMYKAKDVTGPWTRSVLNKRYHDPSLLFDDDGRVYIIYGSGTIRIIELTRDANAIKPGGVNQTIITTSTGNTVNCEGAHAYKINGIYYIFLIQWPKSGTARRIEWCYRSKKLLKGYEGRIVLDDDMGYHNKGVAQGGIVDLPDGQWYAMLFQDHDAVGRIPVLVPVTWTDNWPIMGVNGKVPVEMKIPLTPSSKKTALLTSDDFDQTKPGLNWQWNHNPDNACWSFSRRTGYLRLTTGSIASDILHARNTLSQRTQGPTCSGEVAIQTEHMKPGDYAGIAAFQNTYGFIGVTMDASGQRYIVMATNRGDGNPDEAGSTALHQDRVYCKITFDFNNSKDRAAFYYSLDGTSWIGLGGQLAMKYTLDHFMGYRIALFYYATASTGGYVDFDYFHATYPVRDVVDF
jgi:beta-xylosidase